MRPLRCCTRIDIRSLSMSQTLSEMTSLAGYRAGGFVRRHFSTVTILAVMPGWRRRCWPTRKCLFPQPCYWERKAKLSDAERKRVDALCQPLRKLLDIGSKRDAEGLWLF